MNITQSVVSERDRTLIGGDYNAYRLRMVRQVHVLRRRLGDATPRGRKFTSKSNVSAENVAQDPNWIRLLLASAERHWAHAIAMKSLQSPENTQKPMAGSTKKQIVSRYRRAIMYATNLVEVIGDQSASHSTSSDLLEAKAYLSLLKGGLDFEKNRWDSCITNYAISRLVYSALAATSKTDIFRELLSTIVDPSIRYAAYQLKLPRTKLVSDIAIEKFPSTEKAVASELKQIQHDIFSTNAEKTASQSDQPSTLPTVITWRSRSVKVEDAAVSQAIGVSQDREHTLYLAFQSYHESKITSKDLAAAFDDVINARQDAVDATKNAIDELRAEGIDQGDSRIQSLQVVRTAANYALIEWRVGRNRILCGNDDGLAFEPAAAKQTSKLRKDGKSRVAKDESIGKRLSRLRERVALYESILQSIDSVKELPGVIADAAFSGELDGKRAYFEALKCIAIGRSHALDGKVVNALALYARADDLVKQAATKVQSMDQKDSTPSKLDIGNTQLTNLQSTTSSLVLQHRALAELNSITSNQRGKDQAYAPPLIERFHFNQYEENVNLTNLVNYPPKLQPVPVKPLFFDLAWNYIQYPGKAQASNGSVAPVVEELKTDAKPVKKGWFGFGR